VREGEIGEELWNALVENGAIVTAGFVADDLLPEDALEFGLESVLRGDGHATEQVF
jgi:hypothetical protein